MLPYQNLSLEDMPGEIWKDIPGWGNHYQSSNLGRIKSSAELNSRGYRIYPHIMRQGFNQKGYLVVHLYYKGKRLCTSVGRLVLMAFESNPENKPCVDHIDTNKTNNRIENLRWVTFSENMSNPLTISRRSGMPWLKGCSNNQSKSHHRKTKPVVGINPDSLEIREYASMKDTAIDGFRPKQVSSVCSGVHQRTMGWRFFYADDPKLTAYLSSLREFQEH